VCKVHTQLPLPTKICFIVTPCWVRAHRRKDETLRSTDLYSSSEPLSGGRWAVAWSAHHLRSRSATCTPLVWAGCHWSGRCVHRGGRRRWCIGVGASGRWCIGVGIRHWCRGRAHQALVHQGRCIRGQVHRGWCIRLVVHQGYGVLGRQRALQSAELVDVGLPGTLGSISLNFQTLITLWVDCSRRLSAHLQPHKLHWGVIRFYQPMCTAAMHP
jgi:hypothetical protein